MGGFVNVVRRMAMACLAGGLVFGIPNAALARDPPLQTARLPWQMGPAFASTTPFDDGFTRVVFETKQMIRAFADSSWYSAPPAPIPGRFGRSMRMSTVHRIPSSPPWTWVRFVRR